MAPPGFCAKTAPVALCRAGTRRSYGQANQHKNFEAATGRTWEGWVAFLDGLDARKLSHTEIARRIFDTGLASGWWSQSITVAYEQHIGRRVPGQDCDGAFAVSATKTCAGTLDDVLARWVDFLKDREELGGIAISRGPDTSVYGKVAVLALRP